MVVVTSIFWGDHHKKIDPEKLDPHVELDRHRFSIQQPTLFLAEWGVMRDNKRGNKRGNERGERQQERREATREERGEARQERDGVT